MERDKKTGPSFMLVGSVGLIGVIALAIYLSSHKALPTYNEYYTQSGFATSTQAASAATTTATSTAAAVSKRKTMSIIAPKGTIVADVSNTPALRELGLSGRQSLGSGKRMIFIFPKAGEYGFWMKDMDFSIDMVWIDSSYRVVGVNADASPSSYPNVFLPPANIQFVLELEAGAAQRFGIATGTPLKFVP